MEDVLTAPVVFGIDARDTITSVNNAWDRFAIANDAPEVCADRVLGRPIWDFITDETTRRMYRVLLRRVTGGTTARFAFRCDSPTFRRRLEMHMTPAASGVQFEVRTLAVEERDPQPLWDRRVERDGLVRACSWCKRVNVGGVWKEVEDAVVDLRLFEHAVIPMVTHGMCLDCVDAIEATFVEGV